MKSCDRESGQCKMSSMKPEKWIDFFYVGLNGSGNRRIEAYSKLTAHLTFSS